MLWTKRHRRILIAISAALVTLGAFVALRQPRAEGPPPCVRQQFEGSDFIVCTFDARRDEFRLVSAEDDGDYLRSFRRLREWLGDDAARVRFAMNAGMFNDAGAPIGLYVQQGAEQHPIRTTDGPGNFHLKPNGVFSIGADSAVRVETTEAYVARGEPPAWATQSGPMLVIGGALHPEFQHDGDSRLIRNGVGARDAHTAIFVISRDPVSFGRFARFFRDELNCPDALFLDGSVSGVWAPNLHREDSGHLLGPMAVVLDRP